MQVCAITVAYNNPKELARLLRSLQSQASLNGLIVLDNSREEYLKENEALFRTHADRYPFAHFVHPRENIGSAGAFCQGMKIAHEKGFDWIWLLDQDGTVENGCLASLLRNTAQADILCPQIVDIGDPPLVLPQSGAIQNFWGRMVWIAFTVSRNMSFFATHGALISKSVLDQIGYYDSRNFFVGSEDSDYAFRSTAEHMVIRLVVEAKARHPDARRRSIEKRRGLVDDGVIDNISAERGGVAANHLRARLLLRLQQSTLRGSRLLPEHLGYVDRRLFGDKNCRKTQGFASLSYAYLATKRLTSFQLGAACLYSLLFALFRKLISDGRISLIGTVSMYAICMRSKLRKEWPFESVEQFCMRLAE
jgi:rhamnopyranosyl-N-acetylglucosaminyl-diphospho-decaprenol beta-1,3/1,4-galactofuranosyltransferase